MKSPMQRALGESWAQLPVSLQAHHASDANTDIGQLDISFPRWMTPYLWLLHQCGALLSRKGSHIATRVEKEVVGARQFWRRSMQFPDGQRITFNSFWVNAEGNCLIEFVNPVMGLEMAVRVEAGRLHYEGQRYVLKLGPWLIGIPEWLVLGHTTIVESALGDNQFAMDFRLIHPIFGQVFRYAGTFVTEKHTV